jgi:hypothetical protein
MELLFGVFVCVCVYFLSNSKACIFILFCRNHKHAHQHNFFCISGVVVPLQLLAILSLEFVDFKFMVYVFLGEAILILES